MDELAGVRGGQAAPDLDRIGDGLVDWQEADLLDLSFEGAALDVLEDDVGATVVLARVDDADQVGVRETRRSSSLAAEALELVRLLGDLAMQQLDRHRAVEDLVERQIDGRHAA